MTTAPYPSLLAALQAIVGTEISVARFIEGYVQIEFGARRVSVLGDINLLRGTVRFSSNEPQFRHALEACIGSVAVGVQESRDSFSIGLSGNVTLKIDLAPPSGGSEAFIYNDIDGRVWIA